MRIMLIISFLTSLITLAQEIPPFYFAGTWTEAVRDDFPDIYIIKSDGSFHETITRQVGEEGEPVPYPTVCRYNREGKIIKIIQATEETKKRYKDSGYLIPTNTITYSIKKVKLAEGNQDDFCIRFVRLENKEILENGELETDLDLLDLNDKAFIVPWGGLNVFTNVKK